MNPSNRTIEEKLAIVQQLRNNSSALTQSKPTDKILKTSKYTPSPQSAQIHPEKEEVSPFFVFLIVRIVISVILLSAVIFMWNCNQELCGYLNAMITTEENGNLIDFMSPFTYTLQENVESAPEVQGDMNSDTSAPSEE